MNKTKGEYMKHYQRKKALLTQFYQNILSAENGHLDPFLHAAYPAAATQ